MQFSNAVGVTVGVLLINLSTGLATVNNGDMNCVTGAGLAMGAVILVLGLTDH